MDTAQSVTQGGAEQERAETGGAHAHRRQPQLHNAKLLRENQLCWVQPPPPGHCGRPASDASGACGIHVAKTAGVKQDGQGTGLFARVAMQDSAAEQGMIQVMRALALLS